MINTEIERSTSVNGSTPGTARLLRAAGAACAIGVIAASVFLLAAPSNAAVGQATHAPSAYDSFTSESQNNHLSAVSALVSRRLALADPVAASKWLSGRPISDPAREQAVIDAATALARQRGIDPAFVTRVMRAQIEASKVVQKGLFVRWTHNPASAPKTAPDLTSIRQQLNDIDDALVTAIGDAADVADSPRCGHVVDAARSEAYPGFDALHRKAIHVAWADFCNA
jgi:chorismate mutase